MGALVYIAYLLGFIATIWIVVIAVQNGDIIWAIVSFFCGIAAIIYGVQHFDKAKIPLAMMVLAIVLSVVGGIAGGIQAGG